MQTTTDTDRPGALGSFLRLWIVLTLAYALVKFAVDIALGGFIDLRAMALWELLLVPLGQAVVVQTIRRRVGRRARPSAG